MCLDERRGGMPGRLRKAVPVYFETQVWGEKAQRLGFGVWLLPFGVISRSNTSRNILPPQ
jgi:hypothetical protein